MQIRLSSGFLNQKSNASENYWPTLEYIWIALLGTYNIWTCNPESVRKMNPTILLFKCNHKRVRTIFFRSNDFLIGGS